MTRNTCITRNSGITRLFGFHPLLLLAFALATGLPAHAADAYPSTPVKVNLPTQPLAQALNRFARQVGLELIVPPTLAANKTAPAIAGTLTVREALDRLLAGSGLSAKIEGSTVVIAAAPADSAAQVEPVTQALPAVTVTASADPDEVGDTNGYVPTRTASATKTATPIIATPQSVSVITPEQLEDQDPRSLGEVLSYTPGAFTGLVGSSNRYDYVALRGFADSSVDSTLLDGLRLLSDQGSYSSMQVDPFFLERIDVVRGPASVLYGRASPGGLVALTSKTPEFEPIREVQLTLGNRDYREAAVDLTGPIGDGGTMAYRLVALARALDSQFDFVKEQRIAIAPSLEIHPSANTSLLLQAYLQRDPEGSYHSGVPANASVFATHNGRRISRTFFDGDPTVEKYARDQNFIGYQLAHAFNDRLKFQQNFRYVSADTKLRQLYGYGWAGPTTLNRLYAGADEETSGYTIDNQLEARLQAGGIEHTLLTGVDYQKRHVDGRWDWGTAQPIDVFNPVYGSPGLTITGGANIDRHFEQTGFYLQDQLAFGRWRVTLGGRYDWIKASNQMEPARPARWSGTRFTKRVGAAYLFDNGIAPYFGYADGFNPSLRNDILGNNLPPTDMEQIEVGVRYQPQGSDTLLSAALYNLEQTNVATQPVGFFHFVPAGEIRARGLELEARSKLTKTLSLLAAYTFNDMTFTESPAGFEGNTPYQAPRHLAAFWADWKFLPGYALGAGARYVGTSWGDNANTFKVPAYTVADLMFNVELGQFNPSLKGADLRLNIKNVFDKTYVASCMSPEYCYWGDARLVTATLSYKW